MYEKLVTTLRYCATHSCMGEAPALTGCTAIYDDAPKDCDSCNAVLQWQAADAIEELSKPKWIPVTERLPKMCERVLTYSQREGIRDNFINGYNHWDRVGSESVTHWMPLPEPPAVDTDNQP